MQGSVHTNTPHSDRHEKPVILYDDVWAVVVMIMKCNSISVLECPVLFPFGDLHCHATCGVPQRAFENKKCVLSTQLRGNISCAPCIVEAVSQTYSEISTNNKRHDELNQDRNTSSDISLYNPLRYAWFKVKLCMQNLMY